MLNNHSDVIPPHVNLWNKTLETQVMMLQYYKPNIL